jgi:hypothetical protein
VLARFVSADTVVPGNASGSMDGVQLRPLTVDFHEPGFVGQIAGENNQPFWFQMSDQQRQQAGSPWGPANPQALNRYSYVQGNPLKATDPSGHFISPCLFSQGVSKCLKDAADKLVNVLAWATDKFIQALGIAVLPSDPNRLHHIFGQTKHNWSSTGRTQAENIKLIEEIANDSNDFVSSTSIRGGQVQTYERVVNGQTIVVKVFEDASGNRIISDAWVK